MEPPPAGSSSSCCSSSQFHGRRHRRYGNPPEPAKGEPPEQETKARPPRHLNYCRPVLRGAPFLICSNCCTLVQLPADDFAPPSNKTFGLRCGSCLEVLSYTYRKPQALAQEISLYHKRHGRAAASPPPPRCQAAAAAQDDLRAFDAAARALIQLQPEWGKERLLGCGSCGQVYLGVNRESGQFCAIKEVHVIVGDSHSKERLRQLNQEIDMLRKLSHPNIVKYYGSDLDLTDGMLSVYIEYVPNGSITKLLKDNSTIEEPMIRYYTAQILSGLAYLHGQKTVHRDIKGPNILVGPNGEVKLADFGMAKHISSFAEIHSLKGSSYWMAPEVIMSTYSGQGYNLAVDIWSLGCTVIEMATGRPPWHQYEPVAAMFKIANSNDIPEIPDGLSEEGKSFLQLCLKRNPASRPTAALLMEHPFVRGHPQCNPAKLSIPNEAQESSTSLVRTNGGSESPIPEADEHKCIGRLCHQTAFAFDGISYSRLQASDDEGEYEEEEKDDDDDAAAREVRIQAAARQSGGSLSMAHWRGGRSCGCYRCGKGAGFWGRDMEACLACGARYCMGCVLRAMGSMPEGRKCLDCIGQPVAESKRDALGRGSRVLRRLLSAAEVELVMRSERECAANQLRADDVYVNGSRLSPEELVVLQGCPCPPSRLRPGFYWYDKVSGFWGKEAHQPHCIISANLNVGGSLDQKASNGNTGVLINGREITSCELKMLKVAGVQCARKPHFWVNADGTYQEAGLNTVKGNIWDKPIVKLVSSVLSLPTPKKAANQCSEDAVHMVNQAMPDSLEQRTIPKLLLVGSGASTILKQAKFLYKNKPFSSDEHEDLKLIIQSNIYNYLGILLEGRERFEDEALADRRRNSQHDPSSSGRCESGFYDEVAEYSLIPRLKAFSDWILKAMALGDLEDILPAASREYAPLVEELWKDPAIQATYKRRSELPFLPPAASYFLDKAVDISRTEYELSDMDILYADGITSSDGIGSTELSFPQIYFGGHDADEPDRQDTLLRYQLIRINNRGLHENYRWLENVKLVIFCVAASDYDEYYEDANGTIVNKMIQSRQLFESIALHPTFKQMDFLLLLTKFDILEQKIASSPLTSCDWFDNFTFPSSHLLTGAMLAQMAGHYMAAKFKRLFSSLAGRKLYVSYVNALDQESVRSAIHYGREIVNWEEEKLVFGDGDRDTVYSEETIEPQHPLTCVPLLCAGEVY